MRDVILAATLFGLMLLAWLAGNDARRFDTRIERLESECAETATLREEVRKKFLGPLEPPEMPAPPAGLARRF